MCLVPVVGQGGREHRCGSPETSAQVHSEPKEGQLRLEGQQGGQPRKESGLGAQAGLGGALGEEAGGEGARGELELGLVLGVGGLVWEVGVEFQGGEGWWEPW